MNIYVRFFFFVFDFQSDDFLGLISGQGTGFRRKGGRGRVGGIGAGAESTREVVYSSLKWGVDSSLEDPWSFRQPLYQYTRLSGSSLHYSGPDSQCAAHLQLKALLVYPRG